MQRIIVWENETCPGAQAAPVANITLRSGQERPLKATTATTGSE